MATTPIPPLKQALLRQKRNIRNALWMSSAMGMMALVPSWYMFEVYGRVLNSRNLTTLTWLLVMTLGVHVLLELLDVVRARHLHHVAESFERELRPRVFQAALTAQNRRVAIGATQALTDLKTIKDLLDSQFVKSLLDIPAALICMALLFALGFWLGVLGLIGAAIQGWLIWVTQRHTLPLLTRASGAAIGAQQYAHGALRNAQVIESMGMLPRTHQQWLRRQVQFLDQQGAASDYGAMTGAVAKVLQMMQGSVLLGAATWIMLYGQLWGGAGMVIVASILGGKALQPLSQLVTQWRNYVLGRDAYNRLVGLLDWYQPPEPSMPLPPPQGLLTVEDVHAGPPGTQLRVLRGVSFAARPGEVTAIIGPTAAGKSSLARLIVGVWPPTLGKVRLDGADLHAWNKQELGPHIGYLPQNVELFDGSVAENVARFGDVRADAVAAALAMVGLTETVAALPEGVNTRIGEDGAVLSGGQRQRLGLARALYGAPRLLVLDEPNANLDEAGDKGLLELLAHLKTQGVTTLVVTHRSNLLAVADKLLVLRDGAVAGFGPRDEVLQALQQAAQRQLQAAAPPGAPAARPLPPRPAAPPSAPGAAPADGTAPAAAATNPAPAATSGEPAPALSGFARLAAAAAAKASPSSSDGTPPPTP